MLHKAIHPLLRFLVSPCRISLVWVPWVLCLGGFVLSQCIFYPGAVTPDGFCQFNQIEERIIHDWHPPIMAATWQGIREGYLKITGTSIPGNGVLWTLYNSFIWLGLLLVLRSGQSFWKNSGNFQKSYLFVGLTLFALLWAFLDIFNEPRCLLKDNGFFGSYLIATGCMLKFPKKNLAQLLVGVIAIFFLFYGTALRHNAIFAVIPLLCWFVWLMIPCKKMLVIVPAGLCLWVFLLASIHYINYEVIGAVRAYSIREIFYLDIFQLNARTPRFVLPPNTFGNDFTTLDEATFRKHFNKEKLFIKLSFEPINKMRSDESIYWFWDSTTPYSFDNRDKKAFIEQYNTRKKQIDVQIDAFSHHRTPKNVTAVRNQYPKDYVALRSAWIERVLMDPMTYIKFKTRFFRKFCKDNTLNFLGINALLLSPMLIGIVVCWTLSKKMTRPEIFPCLMLTWSALLYILPLWAFLPDDRCIRYLYWFFAASFIAIVYFCSQSKLFNELVQTIQRYLEEKVNEGKINKEK